jgi:hypothetical protein
MLHHRGGRFRCAACQLSTQIFIEQEFDLMLVFVTVNDRVAFCARFAVHFNDHHSRDVFDLLAASAYDGRVGTQAELQIEKHEQHCAEHQQVQKKPK